ncbi:MAG: ABC transporter ATP-binding protein/permease [Clostridia bacterium]|nr:ABC transporter ATP-binding protein/permease [Clostridia bacterium]
MLQLENISKYYKMSDNTVNALENISIYFRSNEFVSILGPSGCGKTTLLNIIGGLDRYSDGDLKINGRSTKQFSDMELDNYRNRKIGFIFQSYNLIPHQTVFENVEMALTLSGVPKEKRKEKVISMLDKVGLSNKVKALPSQLSGGQMQRVAIARALINNPEILLADEPTGSLDTATSIQIIELLKEIAHDRLVIMVTHNPALAQQYSTRTIQLIDGKIVNDNNPYNGENNVDMQEKESVATTAPKKKNKTHMSLGMAFMLSLRNLMSKKARTFLVSVAGSIGIIGIALVLAISSGFNHYAARVQEDTITAYPVTVNSQTTNYSSLLDPLLSFTDNTESRFDTDVITQTPILTDMLRSSSIGVVYNDLSSFKEYLNTISDLSEHVSNIRYDYNLKLSYYVAKDVGYTKVNALDIASYYGDIMGTMDIASEFTNVFECFGEYIDNTTLIKQQYDLIAGDWDTVFSDPNSAIMWVAPYNTLSDYMLYNIGVSEGNLPYELAHYMLINGYLVSVKPYAQYTEDFVSTMSEAEIDAVLIDSMGYAKDSTGYKTTKSLFIKGYFKDITPFSKYTADYVSRMTEEKIHDFIVNTLMIKYNDIIQESVNIEELLALKYKVLTESDYYAYNGERYLKQSDGNEYMQSVIGNSDTLSIGAIVSLKEGLTTGCLLYGINYSSSFSSNLMERIAKSQVVTAQQADESFDILTGELFSEDNEKTVIDNYNLFGVVDSDCPNAIYIYPKNYEEKNYIIALIDAYNEDKPIDKRITYADTMGFLLNGIVNILSTITSILSSFVSTALIVSSIMIGVITYISVLERRKEIGVLRSIGAGKNDIACVFSFEAIIIGLISGLLGIAITALLCVVINIVIASMITIGAVVYLPLSDGLILVAVSIALSFIAGLIPSCIAANNDPVDALRN